MDRITHLIQALTAFYEKAGLLGVLSVLAVIVGGPILLSILRDRRQEKLYREVINEKEKQIQRLADDNREWRNFFFLKQGVTEAELLAQTQSSSPARPLTAVKEEKQKEPPRPPDVPPGGKTGKKVQKRS